MSEPQALRSKHTTIEPHDRAPRALAVAIFCLTILAALSGCASSSYRYPDELILARNSGDFNAHAINVPEPAADEVVVVINNNAGFGTHAGLFVGARLSDPAGNYDRVRHFEHDWKGPTLFDYVQHQMVDGLRVQLFRFKLDAADINIIETRVAHQGITVPLNCAVEVRDQIANVGLFKALKPAGWLSPNELAEQLLPLIEGPTAVGVCVWPNGRPCRTARITAERAAVTRPQ